MTVMQKSPSADDSRLNISAALILILMASLERLKECGEYSKQERLNGCRAEEFTSSLAQHHRAAGGELTPDRLVFWHQREDQISSDGFPHTSGSKVRNLKESCCC